MGPAHVHATATATPSQPTDRSAVTRYTPVSLRKRGGTARAPPALGLTTSPARYSGSPAVYQLDCRIAKSDAVVAPLPSMSVSDAAVYQK